VVPVVSLQPRRTLGHPCRSCANLMLQGSPSTCAGAALLLLQSTEVSPQGLRSLDELHYFSAGHQLFLSLSLRPCFSHHPQGQELGFARVEADLPHHCWLIS